MAYYKSINPVDMTKRAESQYRRMKREMDFVPLFLGFYKNQKAFARFIDDIVGPAGVDGVQDLKVLPGPDGCPRALIPEWRTPFGVKGFYSFVSGLYGDLDLIKYLHHRFGNEIFNHSNDVDMLCEAIKFGRTDIYEYIISVRRMDNFRGIFKNTTVVRGKGIHPLKMAQHHGYTELLDMIKRDFGLTPEFLASVGSTLSPFFRELKPRTGNVFVDGIEYVSIRGGSSRLGLEQEARDMSLFLGIPIVTSAQ